MELFCYSFNNESILLCCFIKAGGPDYYIEGVLNRNRAFNDDVVVINVLPPDQWKVWLI